MSYSQHSRQRAAQPGGPSIFKSGKATPAAETQTAGGQSGGPERGGSSALTRPGMFLEHGLSRRSVPRP